MARDGRLHETTVPGDHEKIRVLLVDTNISSILCIASALEAQGFTVTPISRKALALLREGDLFDVVAVSLEEQDGDFMAFAKRLRMINAGIPIAVILDDEEDIAATEITAPDTGASFFLRRPISDVDIKNLRQYLVRNYNEISPGKADSRTNEAREIQERESEMMIIEDAGTQEHLPNRKLQGTTHENLADPKGKGKAVTWVQIQDESRISSKRKNKRTVRNDFTLMDLGEVPETTIREQKKCGHKRKLAYLDIGVATSQKQGEESLTQSDCMTSKRRKDSYSRKKKPMHWNPTLCEKFRAALRRSAFYKEASSTTQVHDARNQPNLTQFPVVNQAQVRKQVSKQSMPSTTTKRSRMDKNVSQTKTRVEDLSTNLQDSCVGATMAAKGAGAKAVAGFCYRPTASGPGIMAASEGPTEKVRKQVSKQSMPSTTTKRSRMDKNVSQTKTRVEDLSTNLQDSCVGATMAAKGAGAKAVAGFCYRPTASGPGIMAASEGPTEKVNDFGACASITAVGAGAGITATGASSMTTATEAAARTTATGTGSRGKATNVSPKTPLDWIMNAREKYKASTFRNSSVSTSDHSKFKVINNREFISNMLQVTDAGPVLAISETSAVDLGADATNSNPMPLNIEEERVNDQELMGSYQFPESIVCPSASSTLQEKNSVQTTLIDWNGQTWDGVGMLNEDVGFASYGSASKEFPKTSLYWQEDMGMPSAYQGNEPVYQVPETISQERQVSSVTPIEATQYATQAMGFSTSHASANTDPPIPPSYWQENMEISSIYQENDSLNHVPGPNSQERHASSVTPQEAIQHATMNPISSTELLWTGQGSYAGVHIGNSLQRVEIPTSNVPPIFQPMYDGAAHGGSPLVTDRILPIEYPWDEILGGGYQMPTESPLMPQYANSGTSRGVLIGSEEIPTTMAFQTSQSPYSMDPSNSSMLTEGIQMTLPINPTAFSTNWDNTLNESAVGRVHDRLEISAYPNNDLGSGIATNQCYGIEEVGCSSSASLYLVDDSSNLQDGIRFWDDNFIYDTDHLSTNLAWL